MEKGTVSAEASKSSTPQHTHESPEQHGRRYGCKCLYVEKGLEPRSPVSWRMHPGFQLGWHQ